MLKIIGSVIVDSGKIIISDLCYKNEIDNKFGVVLDDFGGDGHFFVLRYTENQQCERPQKIIIDFDCRYFDEFIEIDGKQIKIDRDS
jgi:hypothetical protein